MTWKDILKAPFNIPKRREAKRAVEEAHRLMDSTKPMSDFFTSEDIDKFATKYLDPKLDESKSSTSNPALQITNYNGKSEKYSDLVSLINKYGVKKLEDELSELYGIGMNVMVRTDPPYELSDKYESSEGIEIFNNKTLSERLEEGQNSITIFAEWR